MNRRSEELYAIAADFLNTHDEWSEDVNRQNPDEAYRAGLDSLFSTFAAGEIPGDCRELSVLVEKFSSEVTFWENSEKPYPRDEFWGRINDIRKMIEGQYEPKLPPLPSMKELAELVGPGGTKVTHSQIARIYGLLDRHGNPQSHLVQQELDEPGSVINDKWIDPRTKEGEQAREETARRAQAFQAKTEAGRPTQPSPQTLKELWQQGVGIEQVAKMKQLSLGDVKDAFAGFDALKAAAQKTKKTKPELAETK